MAASPNGRWDGGVYWQSGAKATHVVYVSKISIAERWRSVVRQSLAGSIGCWGEAEL